MTSKTPPTNSLSVKLLIHTKRKKVLFAEASKDVVDFLFTLLQLPLATVVNILTKEAASGCLGNLYSSVENLNRVYMQPNLSKDLLLHPTILPSSPSITVILPSAARNHSDETTPKMYKCSRNYGACSTTVTDVYNSLCRVCYSGRTTTKLNYMKGEATATATAGTAPATSGHSNNGFVKEVVTYMIMDNLLIQPMSILSGLTMLNHFNVYDVGALKEAVVQLGMNEGLKLLKTCMEKSDKVLTSVFLA
ncbi:uncharacterized protein LOC130950317 [Arachis stenosperma]|uniref:uncharacterized protein LOC130950317 n=1 Tax=Arachis stenosperma TaxID=217475 RepID=UPI0025AB7D5C|nr:uncharacterized protein LOC130950317 [Arachis stenosperma]